MAKNRQSLLRRSVFGALLLGAVASVFGYGVLVGRYQSFPYQLLQSSKQAIVVTMSMGADAILGYAPERSATLITSLTSLTAITVDYLNRLGLDGGGGGLTIIGGKVVGVDRGARFFVYERTRAITSLDVQLETNEGAFLLYVDANVSDAETRAQMRRTFRVLGITSRVSTNGDVELYVSHHYWDAERRGKTTRISRLDLKNVERFVTGEIETRKEAWQVVFDSEVLQIDLDDPLRFYGNHSSGRMVFDREGHLLIALSDQDQGQPLGVPTDVSQDLEASWGKIIRIDTVTGRHDVYALGLRNPQGLYVDRVGNIWETEHGPEGGDELNLIVEGGNYGWPHVTYGTAYGSHEWPLSQAQGRHEGYERPIYAWVPAIAVSSVIQISGRPSAWDGDLLIGTLLTKSVHRVRIRERRAILAEPIPIGEGVRDLIQLPDGTILIWTRRGHVIELVETGR